MACWFQGWKKLYWLRLISLKTLVLLKIDGFALAEKSSLKMLGMTFSPKVDWGSYIISVAKTASKEIGALIRSMPFLSPEAALYLYKSIIQPCMNTAHPSLAASLEPLANNQNVASLSLFYRYHFGQCSSELTQKVPLPYSWGGSTRFSDRLHSFSVTIPICYKDVSGNSFFPRKARLWNSLPIECFPLTYDHIGL